jgi:hypothetical protein
MTIARDPGSGAPLMRADDDPGDDPGRIRRLRVPLLFVTACLLGFVLEFAVGLPGTPVWIGVIVAELAIAASAWTVSRRAGRPASGPDEPDEPDEPDRSISRVMDRAGRPAGQAPSVS